MKAKGSANNINTSKPIIGEGFFNALDSDGRAKCKMEKGKLFRLKYAPSKARLNRSPNSRCLNGKIFLALVHDFKKVDDETALGPVSGLSGRRRRLASQKASRINSKK